MQRVQGSLHVRNLAIPSAQIVTGRGVLRLNGRHLGRWEELAVAPARIVSACQIPVIPILSRQVDGLSPGASDPASGIDRGVVRPSR